MVTAIRLSRYGRGNLPYYRITVADSRRSRDGKFIEQIGFYNPITDIYGKKRLRINSERARYWISVGAVPSDTVAKIFERANILPPLPRKIKLPALPKDLNYKPKWLVTPQEVCDVNQAASPINNLAGYESMYQVPNDLYNKKL